jgi:hypothetical protein
MSNSRDRASLLDISRAAQKILRYKLGMDKKIYMQEVNGEYRVRTGGLCGAIATRYQLR